jgi:spore coat polysaccharide biosynthesis protein SpsF
MNQASPLPSIVVIIQARMNSTRLPGKVLLPLPLNGPTTVLEHVVGRSRRVQRVRQVVVATSTHPADDALTEAVSALPASLFRGDEQDVLGRFCGVLARYPHDVVVRLTADNPALDPAFIDAAIEHHLATGADYTLTTGLPLGTNVEVISAAALQQANAAATLPEEREHVTPYLRRHPELFRLETLALTVPAAVAGLRLTLDYPSDYALLHLLFSQLPADFSLTAPAGLPALLSRHPWLARINDQNEQVQP